MSKLTREEVYKIIDTERSYQDKDFQDKEWAHRNIPSLECELLLAEEYLSKSRSFWASSNDNEEILGRMRKVAGILVRCFENHGCPNRN